MPATPQLIVGDEPYLLQREVNRSLGYQPGMKISAELDRFDATTAKAGQVIAAWRNPGFFGDRRQVVVNQVGAWKTEDWNLIVEELKRGIPDADLIFSGDKIDKRTSAFKFFSSQNWLIEIKKLYPDKIPAWLMAEAKTYDLNFAAGAADELVDAVGTDLGTLIGELQKLELYIHPRRKIERNDVLAAAANAAQRTAFDFAAAVGRRQAAKAWGLFQEAQERGEVLFRLLGPLATHLRKILLLAERLEKRPGASDADLAVLIGVPPFFLRDYRSQSAMAPASFWRLTYTELLVLTEKARSIRVSDASLMSGFLAKVCLKPRQSAA